VKRRTKYPAKDLLVIAIVIILGSLAGFIYYFEKNQPKAQSINSFEECAAAGNPIMESYPEQCISQDGQHFTRQLSGEEKENLLPPARY